MPHRRPPNATGVPRGLSVICQCVDGRCVVKKDDVVGGLVVIGIGLVFLAANLDLMPIGEIWQLWPVALIVIGGSKVLFPGQGWRTSGLPLLLVGCVFLAHNYDVLDIRDSWPLFVVAAGLSILAGSFEQRDRGSNGRAS